MSSLPDKIKVGCSFDNLLGYEECTLSIVTRHDLTGGDSLYIYKVIFNPDFTYNTGYIYIIGHALGGFSRSVRYYRDSDEAEYIAFKFYGGIV